MVLVSSAVLEAALESAENERKYAASKHAIQSLAKDEDTRRLRTGILLLEGDVDELHEQLNHEQECSTRFRDMVDEHLSRAQHAEAALEAIQLEKSAQTHEIGRLQAEIDSLRNSTQDATTILAEKLALARELTILRPELEHLRAQAASVEQLVTEKLALQRELADARCEVESAKAEAKRAQAKRRNTTMEIAQEAQVEDLKKQLAREKRARANAEEIAEQAQGQMTIDDVRRELAKEKRLRERLEEELDAAKENTQIEEVRRDLLKAKKATQRLEDQNGDLQIQLEREQKASARAVQQIDDNDTNVIVKELRDALASEKKARQDAERTYTKKEEQWDLDKTSLDDKLNQFRVKLRETKELLKTTKDELAAATERATKAEHHAQLSAAEAAIANIPVKKNTTKRTAKVVDPAADETALGTPGDGPQAKRSRKVNAAIGSKSSFSITPFLNKTTVVDEEDNPHDSEPEASPTNAKPRTRRPLTQAASIKANSKLGATDSEEADAGKLDAVTEENETSPSRQDQPPSTIEAPIAKDNQVKQKQKAKTSTKQKPRKSLIDFETFQKGDNEPVVKQKKRKLGLRGPTLFDEEEDAAQPETGFGSRPLFRSTPGNRLASRGKPLSVAKNSRSGLMSANDGSGFKFSPLRRDRKTLDDTLRG